jgi:hypothetical protein
LAHSIKIDPSEVQDQQEVVKPKAEAPEEDDFLELGAELGSQVSAKATAGAAMRAKI